MKARRCLVVFLLGVLLGTAGTAGGQGLIEGALIAGVSAMRIKNARPGKCPVVPGFCISDAAASVPVVDDNCKQVMNNGVALCASPAAYYCGVGFVPLYRAKVSNTVYYVQSEEQAISPKYIEWRERAGLAAAKNGFQFLVTRMPSGVDKARWIKAGYCEQLNLVQDTFASGEFLVERMDKDAGLLARWNSQYGAPDLDALKDQYAQKNASLKIEFRNHLFSEVTGQSRSFSYYVGRVNELNRLVGVLLGLDAQTKVAGRLVVAVASDLAEKAKTFQKVLIKVAGKLVGRGNRLFECLTETAMEVGGDLTTLLLRGKEITLDSLGKPALRKLLENCIDAFTSGPGGAMFSLFMKPFESMLEPYKGKLASMVKKLWKGSTLSRQVAKVVDKLDFLLGPNVVKVFTGAADEIVPEFVAEAATKCLPHLVGLRIKNLLRCLGGAAKGALKLLPRALFIGAMDLLEKKAQGAGEILKKLARELPGGDDEELQDVLDAVGRRVAHGAIKAAKKCGEHLVGPKSLGKVLPCLAKALVSSVKKLKRPGELAKKAARVAVGVAAQTGIRRALDLLATGAERGAASLKSAMEEATREAAPEAGGVRLVPKHVVDAISKAARSATDAGAKKFAAEIRSKCLKARPPKSLLAYARASALCVADAATTALKVAGAAALKSLLLELTRFVKDLAKPGKDAAEKLVGRLRAIATMLGLGLPPGGPSIQEIGAALAKDARGVARKAGACVQALYGASQSASKKHERLSSMARLLVGRLQALGPCLARAVGKRGGA